MSARIRLALKQHRLVAAVLATALVVAPAAVIASDRFLDVPNSNIFHDDISAMADAGITLGCGGGYYCPQTVVTREQMAGFLNRGLPRTTADSDNAVAWEAAAIPNFQVADIEIQTGGVPGGTGWVIVDAQVTALTITEGICPCEVQLVIDRLDADGDVVASSGQPAVFVIHEGGPSTWDVGSGSLSWAFEVPTASLETFAVRAHILTTGNPSEAATSAWATMTATYVPYGTPPQDD